MARTVRSGMRCDMHVHTRHSGMCNIPLLDRVCRECYSDPRAVREAALARGMHLVTVTDHDSIDAAEELRRHPDFFLSEEVTCTLPTGTGFHMGVYDIRERDHVELQRRRDDFESLAAYLRERNLFYTVNHVFSSLTGPRKADDFQLFRAFPGVETRNGAMPWRTNRHAEELALRFRQAPVGGSDAHSIAYVAHAYTEIRGARTKEEFLSGIKSGAGLVGGASGSAWALTRTVLDIVAAMMRETPWTVALSPLALVLPAVMLGNYARERWFAWRWMRALSAGEGARLPVTAR